MSRTKNVIDELVKSLQPLVDPYGQIDLRRKVNEWFRQNFEVFMVDKRYTPGQHTYTDIEKATLNDAARQLAYSIFHQCGINREMSQDETLAPSDYSPRFHQVDNGEPNRILRIEIMALRRLPLSSQDRPMKNFVSLP